MSSRVFDSENCVFIGDCIKYNTPDCKDPCFRQREYYFLLDNSNLPEKHKEDTKLIPAPEDLAVFEYLDYLRNNIVDFVNSGSNLVIRGSTGTGKSCWSTKLLRKYIAEVSIGNGFRPRALFINLTWFIKELRRNINEKSAYFSEINKSCYTVDLLVIDDIGATNIGNDFIHDEIYSIINQRIDNELCTIYTTNLSDQELSDNLGDRLFSRVIGVSEVVEIKNRVDFRNSNNSFSFQKFKRENLKDGK